MARYYVRHHPIDDGRRLTFYPAVSNLDAPERPLVVFLHGALREAKVLQGWADTLQQKADVVLLDLPNHGLSSPARPASVETFARLVGDAIAERFAGRKVLLVGESLGGLVAMAIAARPYASPVRAVVAFDPPMSTAKLWVVEQAVRDYMARDPTNEVLAEFADQTFGYLADGKVDRTYHALVGDLRLPTLIVTGTVPLLPIRRVTETPCLFDEADRALIESRYPDKVGFRKIAGGSHLLLEKAVSRCRAIIAEMIDAHLGAPAGRG